MLDLLKNARLFKEFSIPELEEIVKICLPIECKNGVHIFLADTPAESLYIVQEGTIELRCKVTHYSAAKEITIDRKFRGDAFGWSAFSGGNSYTLSALATQDSKLLKINQKDISLLCRENNHLGFVLMKNIAEIISDRFDLVQKMLIDVIQKNLSEKER